MTDPVDLEAVARRRLTAMLDAIDPDAPFARADRAPGGRSQLLVVGLAGLAIVAAFGVFSATRDTSESDTVGLVNVPGGASHTDPDGAAIRSLTVSEDDAGTTMITGTASPEAAEVMVTHADRGNASEAPGVVSAPTSPGISGGSREFSVALPGEAIGGDAELRITALDDNGAELGSRDFLLRSEESSDDEDVRCSEPADTDTPCGEIP